MAVITGGTKGIGRAIAVKFASQNFDIVTCSRNSGELAALKEELERICSIKTHVCNVDLSQKSRCLKLQKARKF